MRLRRNFGFTLVELVLVIGLLASIIAIAAPSIFGAEGKAKTEACQDQMDFIINGFQTHQFDANSPYAFDTLVDGEIKLDAYIVKAVDASEYINIGFDNQVICPSKTPTAYEGAIKDGKLFVYCPTHDAYSHGSLSPRPLKTDPTNYTNLNGWNSTDNNWVVGDHESFFILPIKDQYYHMEIGFQLFSYDDGVNVENKDPVDGIDDPIYEYQYDDPDWYWEIPLDYYPVPTIPNKTEGRPEGYDLDNTNEELAFALAIDLQETEGGYNFSSNALELKNINSNAAEDLTVDIAKNSLFSPEDTLDKTHNRQFFDGVTDWLIVDIVPIDGNSLEKRMYVHMLDDGNLFQQLFVTDVPIPDPDLGEIKFAFFMGKRVEDAVDTDDKKVKNGLYYADAFPSPVQVLVKNWIVEYDSTGEVYKNWYETAKYLNYTDTHPYILEN